jgi:uncharacterized membrane protein YphA (DoxX/SURF4 family)
MIAVGIEIVLGAIFLLAGAGKLLSFERWTISLRGYEIGLLTTRPVRWGVPIIELWVGVALALGLPFSAAAGAVAFAAFAVVLGVAYARGASGECGCLGEWEATTISWPSIARAVALSAIAVVGGLTPAAAPAPSVRLTLSIGLAAAALLGAELREALQPPKVS